MSSRVWKYNPIDIIMTAETSSAAKDCRILLDYARSSYRKNEISRDLYIKFINYIIPICLECAIEDKFNEIIPRWNKRFSNLLYSNAEELY